MEHQYIHQFDQKMIKWLDLPSFSSGFMIIDVDKPTFVCLGPLFEGYVGGRRRVAGLLLGLGLRLRGEAIPDAMHGVEVSRLMRVDFEATTQPQNEVVDRPR